MKCPNCGCNIVIGMDDCEISSGSWSECSECGAMLPRIIHIKVKLSEDELEKIPVDKLLLYLEKALKEYGLSDYLEVLKE
jgi:hypothetical protein